MTTSGHGTKRMLSRGPALLLAPLLLLCRGNPGPAAATPPLRSCLFRLLFVFISVFVFSCLCLFRVCSLSRCYLRPFPPSQPSLPGAPRSAAGGTRSRLRLWGAPRSPHPAPLSPSSSAVPTGVPCPHACRGLPAPCARAARCFGRCRFGGKKRKSLGMPELWGTEKGRGIRGFSRGSEPRSSLMRLALSDYLWVGGCRS